MRKHCQLAAAISLAVVSGFVTSAQGRNLPGTQRDPVSRAQSLQTPEATETRTELTVRLWREGGLAAGDVSVRRVGSNDMPLVLVQDRDLRIAYSDKLDPGTYEITASVEGLLVTDKQTLRRGKNDIDIAIPPAAASENRKPTPRVGDLFRGPWVWAVALAVVAPLVGWGGYVVCRRVWCWVQGVPYAHRPVTSHNGMPAAVAGAPSRKPVAMVGTGAGDVFGMPPSGPNWGPDRSRIDVDFARIQNRISLIEDQIRPWIAWSEGPRSLSLALPPDTGRAYSANGLFAEVPDVHGCFLSEALTIDKKPLSLYHIQPYADGRSATISLCDNTDMHQRALGNHKRLLLPVCDYSELPQHSHTQVVVVKPGRVERIDGGWRVSDKIAVRFT